MHPKMSLERAVEALLAGLAEPVDLIDEEDVPLVDVGEDGGQVAGSLDGRSAGGVDVDPELARDDAGDLRGLVEAARAPSPPCSTTWAM